MMLILTVKLGGTWSEVERMACPEPELDHPGHQSQNICHYPYQHIHLLHQSAKYPILDWKFIILIIYNILTKNSPNDPMVDILMMPVNKAHVLPSRLERSLDLFSFYQSTNR